MVIGRGVLCLKVLPVLFRPETDPGQQLGIAFGQMGFDLLSVDFCPVLVITVYGRMFRLYLYAAISPVPLAAFAGEPSQSIGVSFLKSYAAVCLEGVVIALCCVIYSAYAAARPDVSADSSAAMQVLTYIGELTFNMLVLVGLMKGANQVTREMLGL